jgi:hypothetical protein
MAWLTDSSIHFDLPVIALAEQRITAEEYGRFVAVMKPSVAFHIYNLAMWRLGQLQLQERWPAVFGELPPAAKAVGPRGAPTRPSAAAPRREQGPAPRAQADVDAAGLPPSRGAQGSRPGASKPAAGEPSDEEEGVWTPSYAMRFNLAAAAVTRDYYMRTRRKMEQGTLQRGQLTISGIVEARTAAGFALLDVVALYDPVADRFPTIKWGVRTLKLYDQRPLG